MQQELLHTLPRRASCTQMHRLPGPSHSAIVYRGRCKYKSGKCLNERTTKDNGQPHTLCEPHRLQHNKNQRKSDVKRRRQKRLERGGKAVSPSSSSTGGASDDEDSVPPTTPTVDVEALFPDDAFPVKLEPQIKSELGMHNVVEPLKWDDWSHEDILILGEMVGLQKEARSLFLNQVTPI
ncbi:Aste57867_952 [Aphanomyces stellatus]|uniref:Aste57867_952 protein n=1 Tax=Aphanomyces stellatus TaxID=120398 RepID=A0A485K506_9STRA|nr:hypothetical protein As57867_000951 [Aphanomyces stellatus]VFT78175.1 Aste57867_952 [Aphanomyces stellatus]